MSGIPQPLLNVQKRLLSGKDVASVTGRELLSWFNAERRTPWLTNYIGAVLSELKLSVEPEIAGSNLDVPVSFRLDQNLAESPVTLPVSSDTEQIDPTSAVTVVEDATLRIRVLSAANAYPTTVSPSDGLQVATTIMVTKDFSQLPVVQNRAVKGVVSWKSIGKQLSLGVQPSIVSRFLETPLEIRADTPLIEAIANIASQDYALVNDDSGRLVGLVTTADLSLEFKALSEPFLLLREIETYVRNVLSARLSEEQAASLKDPKIKRQVRGIADLTLGEYLTALTKDDVWNALGIHVDRKAFVKTLDSVRSIRNDVMHFDPDPIQESSLSTLREFVRLLQAVGESLRR